MINNVVEGDCLELLKFVPNKSIDVILCDLPYGYTKNIWDRHTKYRYESPIDLEQLWVQYKRIIKDRGVIILTSQGLFTAELMLKGKSMFKYKYIWEKSKATNFLNAKKQPLRKHEDILIFYKKQPVYNPQMWKSTSYKKYRKDQQTSSYDKFNPVEVKSEGERYPIDILYFKTAETEIEAEGNSGGTVYHPTQKPVELGRYLVKTYSNEGDIVLDNTCGSGSFLVSALLEKRKFIGIEKNIDIFHIDETQKVDLIQICKKRLKNIDNSLFPELNT